jgi:hypothetical protein
MPSVTLEDDNNKDTAIVQDITLVESSTEKPVFIQDKIGEPLECPLVTDEDGLVRKEEASDVDVSSDDDSSEEEEEEEKAPPALSEDEEEKEEKAPRTKHEMEEMPPISLEELVSAVKQVDENAPLKEMGQVYGFVEEMLVVQSGSSGDITVLDMDTIVFMGNRAVIGKVRVA